MAIYTKNQQEIAENIQSESKVTNWLDWKWQVRHAIKTINQFELLTGIQFTAEEKVELQKTIDHFPLSITPYYLSLIDKDNYQNDPIFKQAFADPRELIISKDEMKDPLDEENDSPVPGITHRYPDRVLFLVSNVCAMYCRHCTRKRKVGDVDNIPSKAQIQLGLDYIRNSPQVRDVLLSGGDPFLLSDDYLDWILTVLRAIPHVQV
ncbi:MAG: lysine 2,3-aminomutase, partial [Paludibacteraceae bacterium]|nr:lysine 2,3-aminomutase [Paludibacteraceae bacterium]